MTEKSSRDAAYFDAKYAANPDPWNFATSAYEHAKYDATIAALGDRRFASGFEIGCSIGVLTERLAPRCGRLLAVDLAAAALSQAARRCASHPHVAFERRRVPDDWPDEPFDLVIFSEVLYFLTPADIARTASLTRAHLRARGLVVLVNFTEQIDEPCTGEEAARLFIAASPALTRARDHVDARFRIDVLEG